jgi:2-polyprenyl-6-hydroxyphenyl methylase/3-demethylubiquinone-9 3-methyltransferase
LDYGCGDGRFLVGLGNKGIRRVAGADVSREAVGLAKAKCAEMQIMHIDGKAALPFSKGEFSSISLLDVLEHVDEPDAVLVELYRVLKDDGTLIVTVPGQHMFWTWAT